MPVQRFERLEVWQAAHRLTLQIYKATRLLPSSERFGLVSQTQRAAASLPANVAEGFKRRGRQDKVRFYNIAQASLEELRYYVILRRDLGYPVAHESLAEDADRISRMLHGLVESVRV